MWPQAFCVNINVQLLLKHNDPIKDYANSIRFTMFRTGLLSPDNGIDNSPSHPKNIFTMLISST